MKVALIAVGDLARYFVEILQERGHEILAISRSRKTYLETLQVRQLETDYNEADLVTMLADCDAAICTLRVGVPEYVAIHQAILRACQQSSTCKRLIPATWAGNIEDHPDEPIDVSDQIAVVLDALRSQSNVRWSSVSPGWYMDYIVPGRQRFMSSLGEMWPQNLDEKTFTLYGDGTQMVNFTSARDTARATVRLLEHNKDEWEDFTFISGAQMSWKDLAHFIQTRDPDYTLRRKSLSASIKQYCARESLESYGAAILELWGHSAGVRFDWDKVELHRAKFFPDLKFRNVQDLVEEAASNLNQVV
ncbi:NAD(P)-binding protein [Aspergillus leporis]|uniref:NAD(P)-binding protein n=1 Tax=Aspergillus leporis TaxID=41062 RepID=A0A5N5WG49_9EURO|nr:NAD(P)-binding protein [Aspergillus leporis]